MSDSPSLSSEPNRAHRGLNYCSMIKYTNKTKRTRKKAQTAQNWDVFTSICKTDLKVTCVKEHRFHPVRKWRFDYAIPEHKIALEVEGGVWTDGRHVRAEGFLGDMEKYNTATLMGWRVLRTTPDDLYKTATLRMIRTAISREWEITSSDNETNQSEQ